MCDCRTCAEISTVVDFEKIIFFLTYKHLLRWHKGKDLTQWQITLCMKKISDAGKTEKDSCLKRLNSSCLCYHPELDGPKVWLNIRYCLFLQGQSWINHFICLVSLFLLTSSTHTWEDIVVKRVERFLKWLKWRVFKLFLCALILLSL